MAPAGGIHDPLGTCSISLFFPQNIGFDISCKSSPKIGFDIACKLSPKERDNLHEMPKLISW